MNIEIKLYQSSHLLGAIFTTIHPVESIGSHGGAGGVSVSVSTRLVGGKNDNLWESLDGFVVNGDPREVPRVLMESLGSILKAPSRFSSGKPSAKGLGFAFGKSFESLQYTPMGLHWILSWTSLGAPFTTIPPRLTHRLSHSVRLGSDETADRARKIEAPYLLLAFKPGWRKLRAQYKHRGHHRRNCFCDLQGCRYPHQ